MPSLAAWNREGFSRGRPANNKSGDVFNSGDHLKELPYFRFTVSEWQNGRISEMPDSCKGTFVDICCYYWAHYCELTDESLFRRFKTKTKTIQKLIKTQTLCIQNGIVSISFLDQEYNEIKQKKSFFSEMGKKGQKAKKNKAPLKPPLSDPLSIKIREDKIREDKTCFSFDLFWSAYGKKQDRARCEKKYSRLSEKDRAMIMVRLPEYVRATPEPKFRKNPLTYLNGRNWEDEMVIKNQSTNNGMI